MTDWSMCFSQKPAVKDEFAIYLQHLERTIQQHNVQKLVPENGFHFHKQRIYTEPSLHPGGQLISVKGIQGNENVGKLAKTALNRASSSGKFICCSDLKSKVNAYIHTVWQENWDAEGANKLPEVFPNLGDLRKRGEGAGRKWETVMSHT
ncbi:cytochrome p450 3a4-like [Plakobranchus ocellatus]|uniref:Cytochrome p450 3a4-like n=1 Tax=Plakobranchus ocellatus TaxID=259542 RepID=A0AAV4DL64_9GAST|nr:cytochrome p450 3a4-like [Plakobranchus ocellatus]